MKKNGFAFVEIIITVVVLCTSLLILYSTYSAILSDENTRLYYDDPAFIYKTNYVKEFLKEYTVIEKVKENFFANSYVATIGTGFDALFKDSSSMEALEIMVESFKIKQMVLVKSEMFDNCAVDTEEKCEKSLGDLSYNLQKYINTLNDTSYDFYLVIVYSLKETSNEACISDTEIKCKNYYASLPI